MMKKWTLLLFMMIMVMLLPGCWSQKELTELGFVMGIAFDQGKDGKIEMLTQIYRPISVQSTISATTKVSTINIKTTDDSVMEAIRDITIHLGRKAQFSHMRVIIVGEKLARSINIAKLLDLFYRDHEPRSSVSLAISKGKAARLFEKQPLIEQTTAQQILRADEIAYASSAKTMDTTLLSLIMDSKSAHTDAVVAYVSEDKVSKKMLTSAGLALIKNGKMKVVLPSGKVEGLLMLRDEYKSGTIEIPCKGKKFETESTEILSIRTKVKPAFRGDKVSVSVKLQGDVAVGELKCSKLETPEEEAAFVKRVEEKMTAQMRDTVRFLQTNKIEVIGIGNEIYKDDPMKWEKMKKNWDKQFADISFDIKAQLRIVTNGTTIGKPVI